MDSLTDRWIRRQMDGETERLMDRRTNEWMEIWWEGV